MARNIVVYEKGDIVGHPEFGRGEILEDQIVKGSKTNGVAVKFDVSGRKDDLDPQDLYPLWGQQCSYMDGAESLRIKLPYSEAIRIYNAMVEIWNENPKSSEEPVEDENELMGAMSCGRTSFGISIELLTSEQKALLKQEIECKDPCIIMVADKEVYPPVFRIGGC